MVDKVGGYQRPHQGVSLICTQHTIVTGPGSDGADLLSQLLKRLRQEDGEFKSAIGYRVGSKPAWVMHDTLCQNKEAGDAVQWQIICLGIHDTLESSMHRERGRER